MDTISANDLKTRGVSVLEDALADAEEVAISVRGKPRFVVMEVEQYRHLREQELYAAWLEARGNVAAGKVRATTAAGHRREMEALLATQPKAKATPLGAREPATAYRAGARTAPAGKPRRRRA